MKGEHRKLWISSLVLTIAFIWGNSMLSPQQSWAFSNVVQQLLSFVSPLSAPHTGNTVWGTVVRKLAHFTEFAILGVLLFRIVNKKTAGVWRALSLGAFAALIDETIQHYTGRTSSVLDVWLDTLGVSAGILLCLATKHIKAICTKQNVSQRTTNCERDSSVNNEVIKKP